MSYVGKKDKCNDSYQGRHECLQLTSTCVIRHLLVPIMTVRESACRYDSVIESEAWRNKPTEEESNFESKALFKCYLRLVCCLGGQVESLDPITSAHAVSPPALPSKVGLKLKQPARDVLVI